MVGLSEGVGPAISRIVFEDVLGFVSSTILGGGFKHFLFSPLFGEDSHFD